MIKPDFDTFDRALGHALACMPANIRGDHDLWYLRSELRCLQMKARRLKMIKERAREIAKKLGVRRRRPTSE